MCLVRVNFIADGNATRTTVIKHGGKVALKGGNSTVSFGSVVEGTNVCVCTGVGGLQRNTQYF
jgi:hypothetical protein